MLGDKRVGVWGSSATQGERYLPPAFVFCLVPSTGQDGDITADSPAIPFPAKTPLPGREQESRWHGRSQSPVGKRAAWKVLGAWAG